MKPRGVSKFVVVSIPPLVEGPMKLLKSGMFAFALLLMSQGAVFAQEAAVPADAETAVNVASAEASYLKPIGAGLVIVGAALGIGLLAAAAVQSMARQPEIAGNIQTAMIIAAALIEGVTFFALLLQLLT